MLMEIVGKLIYQVKHLIYLSLVLPTRVFKHIQSANDNPEYRNLPELAKSGPNSSKPLSKENLNATVLALLMIIESSLVVCRGNSKQDALYDQKRNGF